MTDMTMTNFKKRAAVVAVASCLSLAPWLAEAASLGKITVLSGLGQPLRAEIDVHGRSLVVYAVHPPTPRSLAQWTTRNAQLAWVADLASERDGSRPRIMLGDFNTPPWSFLFRDVNATAALRDAGGTLRQATRQPMLLAPHLAWLGAPVDHVLVSPDIGVGSFAVGPYVHSDHLPVIADLLLPGPGSSPPP